LQQNPIINRSFCERLSMGNRAELIHQAIH
jgi:hypothetical protein